MHARSTINSLGYLGLIPFAGAAWLIWAGDGLLGLNPRFLFGSYSAVILGFLGGALWGRSIALESSGAVRRLLLLSNAVALLAWFSLLADLDQIHLVLTALMLGYALLLVAEWRYFGTLLGPVGKDYLQMRFVLTTLVLLAHITVLIIA